MNVAASEISGKLLLVRHARPDSLPLAFYDASVPIVEDDCTPAFQDLAQRLPGQDMSIWIASNMVRAQMTASNTIAHLPEAKAPAPGKSLLVSPDFAEQDFGRWAQQRRRYDIVRKAMFGLPLVGALVRPPEGESFRDMYMRAAPALTKVSEKLNGLTGVIFTHQGIIQSAAAMTGEMSLTEARETHVPYLSVTDLDYKMVGGKLQFRLNALGQGGVPEPPQPIIKSFCVEIAKKFLQRPYVG